jgi:hypothetical protein
VRRLLPALIAAAIVFAASPALAGGHRSHRHSGVEGTVFNTTCPGPCPQPLTTAPPYTDGDVTVTVRRVRDGALMASVMPATGKFRIRVRRGHYDVTATVPPSPPCGPVPVASKIACPVGAGSIQACPTTGDTVRLAVRRHRFTHVVLHVQNVCIVTSQ